MAIAKEILHVEGVSCGHCENRVKKAVAALDGIQSVSVDLKGKTVSVEYDPAVASLASIKEAIEDQGYEVK